MALVTLQMIFQDAFPAYAQTHPLPACVFHAKPATDSTAKLVLGQFM
jgi:hypothetical protein